jgi:nucleoside-diphosphate-sugar epimerase
MTTALLGYTGFVGSTLLRQQTFDQRYRANNIGDIDGKTFERVICAAAPGQKWRANQNPEADWQAIENLIGHLRTVSCRQFVLISTVDVFREPHGVDENSPVLENGLHAYGLHRYRLEQFVEAHFPEALIVRLPGLVGPGLRKNVIFDLHNGNNLDAIDSRALFQFYPMVNLSWDIQAALDARLQRLHLSAQPISVGEVARLGFGRTFSNRLTGPVAHYDLQSRHAQVFGSRGRYPYSFRDTVQAIRAYAQSEPRTLPAVRDVHP